MTNYTLVDMSGQISQPGKPFDGMRAGTFVDMRGTRVTFDLPELAAYVDNTRKAIEATRGESGQIVGLPIDAQNHNKGDAAGWIIAADLAGDVIRLTPQWTDLGLDLIGSSRQRFFSPTVDLSNKTIIGGSLTNWPATRAGGKTLLRPIELAAKGELQMEEMLQKMLDILSAIWAKVGGEKAEETPAEEQPIEEPEMQMAKAAEFAQVLEMALNTQRAQIERKTAVADFAKKITGGTPDNPRGLSIPADALTEALLSLPDEGLEKVKALLEKAVVVDFAEVGKAGRTVAKEQLPTAIAPYLRQWVAAGKDVESFFSVNPELGKVSDFDLAEFATKG